MAQATARSSSILLQGSVVGGRYQILRVIGIGSMGTVYVCKAVKNPKKLVAMKVLNPSATEGKFDQNFLARFEREVAVAQVVQHPNVVSFVDVISGEDLAAHILEYVPGGDLAAYIRLSHPVPYREAGRLLSEICAGCEAIHEAAIIHRDLKPENILLTESRTAKISDFGLARISGGPNLTAKGGVVGTIRYLSPEYIEAGTVSPLGDIHAIGLLGYELVTGKSPYAGLTFYETIEKKVQEDLPPLTDAVSTCPPALAQIIDKACRRRAEDRFQSAREMREALIEILPSLPPQRDPSRLTLSSQSRARPVQRKRRSPLLLASLGILAGFVTILGMALVSRRTLAPDLGLRTQIAEVTAPATLEPLEMDLSLGPVGPAGPEIPVEARREPPRDNSSPQDTLSDEANLLTDTRQVVPPIELLLPQAAELAKPLAQPTRSKPVVEATLAPRQQAPVKVAEKREPPLAPSPKPETPRVVAPPASEPMAPVAEPERPTESIPVEQVAPLEVHSVVEPAAEYKVRGTLLYRFADYVKWPQNAFAGTNDSFRICIIGPDPYGKFLDSQVARTQTRQGRSFAVSRFANVPSADVLRLCQLAYVSEEATRTARSTLRALRAAPILVVTEESDYSMINFVIDEGKVKFSVNRQRAEGAGLGIGSVLLDLAVEVVE